MRLGAVPLLAVLLASFLQGCGDEPTVTRVAPPQGGLPEDAALHPQAVARAPAAGATEGAPVAPVAPGDRATPAGPDSRQAAPVPARPPNVLEARRQAAKPAERNAGDPQGARLLAQRSLLLPVVGVPASALSDHYELARGKRSHEAIDIMAATGTPVVAVDDGRIAKLFTSKAGGLTVYQFDAQGQLAYYYAHLDRYAEGLKEGMQVRRGDPIGTVGSTGNANPQAPHLHFAVFRLGDPPKWWQGEPVNPYPALSRAEPSQQLAAR